MQWTAFKAGPKPQLTNDSLVLQVDLPLVLQSCSVCLQCLNEVINYLTTAQSCFTLACRRSKHGHVDNRWHSRTELVRTCAWPGFLSTIPAEWTCSVFQWWPCHLCAPIQHFPQPSAVYLAQTWLPAPVKSRLNAAQGVLCGQSIVTYIFIGVPAVQTIA